MNRTNLRRFSGFTLVELMVTVSLAAILLTLAVPSYQNMVRENRLATRANDFLTALNLARSEAAKRGDRVTLCKADLSSSPPRCDAGDCDTGSGEHCWEKGWIVFSDAGPDSDPGFAFGTIDDDGDVTYCEDTDTDCVVRIFDTLPEGMTLRPGDKVEQWISYRGTGEAVSDGGSPNDTFRLCILEQTANARSIAISSTGRPRVKKGLDAGKTCL
jgi:type IV fimbrial biogenesis protein FimT